MEITGICMNSSALKLIALVAQDHWFDCRSDFFELHCWEEKDTTVGKALQKCKHQCNNYWPTVWWSEKYLSPKNWTICRLSVWRNKQRRHTVLVVAVSAAGPLAVSTRHVDLGISEAAVATRNEPPRPSYRTSTQPVVSPWKSHTAILLLVLKGKWWLPLDS